MATDFLDAIIANVRDVERRARESFAGLTEDQLNWSPQAGSWSIAQCLDHLVTANDPYFPIFAGVANGTHQTTLWERLPLLPNVFGKAVYNTVRPETKRKSKAPRIFQPRTVRVPIAILDTFCAQQQKLVAAMASLENVDLDKTIVTSPVARFITYSLRHALLIVTSHEERHMQQAERVLRAMTD